MISKKTLQDAALRNIINAEQVDPLYDFLNQDETLADRQSQDEPLKFIRSFGDVFITLGVVLLALAINMSGISGYYYLAAASAFVLIAEWLVRIRRLTLPGIAILLAILYFVNKALHFDFEYGSQLSLASLCLTSLLFYIRYRMPFSLFPLAAGIVAIIIIQIDVDVLQYPIIFMGLGLVVFSIAMAFDAHDTKRVSHLSDSAFWLHLLAAPLIVHGVMVTLLISNHPWIENINKEVLMVVFFAVFFLLALLLDRRALLISTQLYIIYAFTQLLKQQLSSGQNIVMLIMMALGLFIIFFGSYWYWARRKIFGFLRATAISRYIPDLNQQDGQRK